MTDYQINEILLVESPLDREARHQQPGSWGDSYEDVFRHVWRSRGLTKEEIDQKWEEYLKEEGE